MPRFCTARAATLATEDWAEWAKFFGRTGWTHFDLDDSAGVLGTVARVSHCMTGRARDGGAKCRVEWGAESLTLILEQLFKFLNGLINDFTHTRDCGV